MGSLKRSALGFQEYGNSTCSNGVELLGESVVRILWFDVDKNELFSARSAVKLGCARKGNMNLSDQRVLWLCEVRET